MESNDCFKCKHRRAVPGSAHSACALVEDHAEGMVIALNMMQGNVIRIQKDGADLIEFNEIGIREGWCMWPINFDPVWVTCRLPIE